MLDKIIDTCEELKKYVFIIDRKDKGNIIIKFRNEYFYHLIGLQYTNIDMFIPKKYQIKQINTSLLKKIKKNLIKL